MPRGEYAILDAGHRVGVEAFTSAPGPMGWRYFATVQRSDGGPSGRVDISVDADGRPVRARIATGEHDLLLAVRGGALQAILDGEPIDVEHASVLAYPSPGFLAAELHRLEGGDTVRALAIDPVTLVPRGVPRTYEPAGEGTVTTPAGAFRGTTWRVDGRDVTITDTVVLSVEGAVELRAYEAGATGPQPRLRSV